MSKIAQKILAIVVENDINFSSQPIGLPHIICCITRLGCSQQPIRYCFLVPHERNNLCSVKKSQDITCVQLSN